jgi:putative endonuclease
MHYVYILRSEASGRFYVGSSQDVQKRLDYHNTGKVRATRYLRPLVLAYQEAHATAKEARQREYHLKRQKSRRVLEALISAGG